MLARRTTSPATATAMTRAISNLWRFKNHLSSSNQQEGFDVRGVHNYGCPYGGGGDEKRRRTVRDFHSSATMTTMSSSATFVDTMIIGGGPIGSSTAYHLALASLSSSAPSTSVGDAKKTSIWVVERDPTYRSASATVSASSIRQQFSLKENVQMSAYGRDFLRNVSTLLQVQQPQLQSSLLPSPPPPNVQFQEHGYLFLASTPEQVDQMKHNHWVQTNANCEVDIHLLSREELQVQFPWLNTKDLALGSFGKSGEGWFDPWALLMAFKEKNVHDLGVVYKHAEPLEARRDATTGAIHSVLLQDKKTGDTEWIHVGNVVNAAGAYANDLLQTLASSSPVGPLVSPFPVRPRKRSMFFFHCREDPPPQQGGNEEEEDVVVMPPRYTVPLTVEPTLPGTPSVYFRSEGPHFLCGVSPPPDEDVDCMDPVTELAYGADYDRWWDDVIWPTLFHRVPAFGNIKVMSSWAGLYEYNTLDQNAIIDFHPEIPNLLCVNGFSGHGLQHSPAAGRAAAELLRHGRGGTFQTLDLNIFSYDRILGQGSALLERGIV